MNSKPYLSLEDARRIIAAARTHAQAHKWSVSICVCDDGGHLLALERTDGAAPFTARMAIAKGAAAALGRRESKAFEDMINQGRVAFVTAPLEGLLEGGVPILAEGHVVGAVGVSGVKSAEDAEIARAGLAALEIS
ncbi:MAG TPA: heme-binding protein [Steroidobacteraceae bacterium]|nr:heme-binding protein [Steroidobacteraceae bacterium]